MLSEVKIYRLNKKTKKLEYYTTISKKQVKLTFDKKLEQSRAYYNTSSSTKFTVSKKKIYPNHSGNTAPSKYAPGVTKRTCNMCNKKYYATNKRNTKFCSQKCGRDMSNEYKKERDRVKRNKP